MDVCGKSFSPVLGAGDVWKGTQSRALRFHYRCLSTLAAFSPLSGAKVLVLGLGPLSGCAEGSGLLNRDGTRATVPQASGQHGHRLDPAL